ncbi:MAG: rhodanese-like domain-containing protein [Marivibrio sp.]|uniref:rhodanese-like domain-containing protein n=1 Tax=Marivibrio sp. TaxID=2039719 RepID=UPI0032EF73E8
MTPASLSAAALHDALTAADRGERELAPIDVREEGVFGAAHLLRAVNLPLSRLELWLRALIPRKSAPIVLMDDADGLAERAAQVMALAGYTDLSILEGGVAAWAAAGYELFSGVNVPSKVFGEYVEHRFGTPHLSAQELKAKLDAREDLVILDSRPMAEYRLMNIPGGVDAPGAELVWRVRALAPDARTTVVVNCAGRTRSIIGAQSLINAGLENPVFALKNGTMGWHLAGFALERGESRQAPAPDAEAQAWAKRAARRVAERFRAPAVTPAELERMQRETDRTTYLLDVRDPAEFEAGRPRGARNAPGGQLVQATDRYVGVLGARIVLVDAEQVRAPMTASWLIQMGWPEVYVLDGGVEAFGEALESGPARPCVPELEHFAQSFIDADALAELGDDVPILDLSTSLQHKRGHVPGARFAARVSLADDLGALANARLIVLTATDERTARLAANDLTQRGVHRVRVLRGGLAGWRAAGRPIETGLKNPLSDPDRDVYERPYDLEDGVEAAMQAYLDWEIELIRQIERDGTLTFPDFAPDPGARAPADA